MKKLRDKINDGDVWFCPQPFAHIFNDTRGNWRPCMHSNYQSEHNVSNTNIKEWFTKNDYLNNIRQEMLTEGSDLFYTSRNCISCIRDEQVNKVQSERQMFIKRLDPSIIDAIDNNDGNIEKLLQNEQHFIQVIPRAVINNTCDQACYTCSPANSTAKNRDIKKLGDQWNDTIKKDYNISSKIKYNKYVNFEGLDYLSKNIDTIILMGGEPLIVDSHYKMLETVIHSGHSKNIMLTYYTNLNNNNKLDKLSVFFSKFKCTDIRVSVDGFGKYNNYLRQNSEWESLKRNILKLKTYKNIELSLHPTISILSILRFDLFEQFCKDNNLLWSRINPNVIMTPDFLRICHLPDDIKDQLKLKYKHIHRVVEHLNMPRSEKQFQKALSYCIALDNLYKRDDKDSLFGLWPELKKYKS